jgi:hypothetical protein
VDKWGSLIGYLAVMNFDHSDRIREPPAGVSGIEIDRGKAAAHGTQGLTGWTLFCCVNSAGAALVPRPYGRQACRPTA